MVGFSPMTASANSEDAVSATPPPQQFKAAPPGTLTREHRAGPRSSHPAGLRPRGSLNRIGSAFPLPQPVLRCKRQSQLSRYRTPVRPHVLHSLPCSPLQGGPVQAVGSSRRFPRGRLLRQAQDERALGAVSRAADLVRRRHLLIAGTMGGD